jgi:hypothetical protein
VKITEIEKVKLDTPLDIPTDELSKSTLDEAKELLGYVPALPNEVASPNPLHKVLAELGIEVLNWRQVITYQAQMAHESRMQQISHEQSLPHSRSSWSWPGWTEVELTKYHAPIPIHVIEKCTQIKRRLPEVEFFVESLSDQPDPFLVAKMKSPAYSYVEFEYFIEVWEEPKFER